MSLFGAKSCYILFYIFHAILYVTANPRRAQNNFNCIRLNDPPYFYCNLSENPKQNDEITVRITPRNEKDSYPIYPYPSTTTTTTSEHLTTPISFSNENSETPESISRRPNLEEKESSSKFENDFSTTEKSHIFTTTASSSSTSGFLEETFSSSSVEQNTLSTTTPVAPKDDSSFIISELSQPLPPNRGPTIMEELFIDTLTKSQKQHQQHQNEEEETPSFEPFHNEYLTYSNRQLFSLCRRFLPFAREHCHREWTHPNYISQCRGYFQDCERFIPRSDPLQEATRALQMNVRYGNQEFPFRSIHF